MSTQKIYLDNYDLDQAIDQYLSDLKEHMQLEEVEISSKEALDHITSQAVYAKVSSPNYNASAMDGICLKAEDSNQASENNPVFLNKDQYKFVDTGDVITSEYDSVIMIEDIVKQDDGSVMITSPAAYFQHVRPIGEDITQTQMIIPSYHRIRAVDIGPLLASKNETIKVFKKLSVGIIPTGTEIVDVKTKTLEDGMIIDSNSSMIKAMVNEMKLDAKIYPIIEDDYDVLKENILKACEENDIVIMNAGSSAGSEDYTPNLIEELGKISVYGIAIKPGKPAILGRIDKTMVVGLPGYPVSTYIVFEQVFKPIIEKLYKQPTSKSSVVATLTKTIHSSLKHMEFVRVKIGFVNDKVVCTPLARGAGISMSLAEADGMLVVPKNSEGYNKGSEVNVVLFKPIDVLKQQLIVIGSHDLILDVMQDVLNNKTYNNTISSTHVGSYAGLLALKDHECNVAPIHILANDGSYNIEIVKDMFKGEKMALIKGVKRQQVLAYSKNNPKNIKSIKDLTRKDIKYVNRQAGSGTAILLDYLLETNDVNRSDVDGYNFIMPSHFNVGATIKNATADCGLLIKSVANILDLDYLEVLSEEYDFLIYEEDLEKENIKDFIAVLKDDDFASSLEQFDCYDATNSGTIIKIG